MHLTSRSIWFTQYLLLLHREQYFYRMESLHPPRHPVKAELLTSAKNNTPFIFHTEYAFHRYN